VTPRGADPDERAVRRVSRSVGLQLTIAASVLVVLVVIAAFAFVFEHLTPGQLFGRHEEAIDIGGLDLIAGAAAIGAAAIVLAALLSWVATRRAVRPLAEALRLQRAFVADASHELRTPLAVLDARLQSLQRRLPADDPSAATLEELRRDTGALVQIVNELLDAADRMPGEGQATPVLPVVRQAVESMRLLAADRNVVIELDAGEDAVAAMPEAALHRCLVAILDNALSFSPAGSRVDVVVRGEGASTVIAIRDRGPGITGIDPSAVFDRFARGEQPDGRPGSGIGLALVRDAAARAGGSARVADTGPGGTTIELHLPRVRGARR
jgi:two-component system, OmpR family, sensor kinase